MSDDSSAVDTPENGDKRRGSFVDDDDHDSKRVKRDESAQASTEDDGSKSNSEGEQTPATDNDKADTKEGIDSDSPENGTESAQNDNENGNDDDEKEEEKEKDPQNDGATAAAADGEEDEDTHDGGQVRKFVFDNVEYKFKERPAVIEEQEGKIEFRVVNNDGSRDHFMLLTGLKNIFQKQLPKMPKEYIARLVYDRSHMSIAVVRKPMRVVGGITYRPFESRKFAEIVFCAISATEQVRGYGAHLMNHFKDFVKNTSQVMYFLTYADNYAIGFFKKQGFTKEISLDKSVWMGYIKDYEGGTLMQCSMLPKIRYLDASKILLLQKAAIMKKIREISKSHIVRPGLKAFKDGAESVDPMTIPGLKEAGWTPEMDELARRPKRGPHFAIMQHLMSEMQNHASAWPFMQPVNRDEVPDYYEVIKEPMDLSTMESRLEADYYASVEDFLYDARLVFNNCRQYNNETTTYYKNATKLEKFLYQKIREIPEYTHLVE